ADGGTARRGGRARAGGARARRPVWRRRRRRRRPRRDRGARVLLDRAPDPSAAARTRMKVLIVTGIWPPDVGGPASHAPEVAEFLLARGHDVEVVTTADRPPEPRPYPVRAVPRRHAPGIRHYRGAALVRRRARANDVIYTTGMLGRSSVGALLARTPFVLKLTADPAFERARRWGLWRGSLDDFQRAAPVPTLPLRLARDADVRRAAHVVTPSAYLRTLAIGWGVQPDRATVLPNPAPPLPELRDREELRRELGFEGPTLAFAGRLTAQKSLDVAIAAARRIALRSSVSGMRASWARCRARACSSSSAPQTRRSSPPRGRTSRTASSRRLRSGRP